MVEFLPVPIAFIWAFLSGYLLYLIFRKEIGEKETTESTSKNISEHEVIKKSIFYGLIICFFVGILISWNVGTDKIGDASSKAIIFEYTSSIFEIAAIFEFTLILALFTLIEATKWWHRNGIWKSLATLLKVLKKNPNSATVFAVILITFSLTVSPLIIGNTELTPSHPFPISSCRLENDEFSFYFQNNLTQSQLVQDINFDCDQKPTFHREFCNLPLIVKSGEIVLVNCKTNLSETCRVRDLIVNNRQVGYDCNSATYRKWI